ncbi:MAG TPA: NYN domain-containing protein [Elusimicrobiota bacterium]|nr:NYN domain-containing protein [Elusimicrobiota bacterium]
MTLYLIDGYNLIRSADFLAAGPLRDQRERLIRLIEQQHPQGSARHRVTVVFDGRDDVSSPSRAGSVEVLFSRGRHGGEPLDAGTADALIKERVDRLAHPRDSVVVTDDKALQKWVRGAGAKVLSCRQFLAAAKKNAPAAGPAPNPPAEDGEDITEELKRLWNLR